MLHRHPRHILPVHRQIGRTVHLREFVAHLRDPFRWMRVFLLCPI
jgi:hypothetical protein